ncbi:hypothetical protein ACFX2K_001428 [Malus domestica]
MNLEFGNRTIIEEKPLVRKLGNSLAYRLFFRSSLLKHLKLFSNLMRQYQVRLSQGMQFKPFELEINTWNSCAPVDELQAQGFSTPTD